MNLSQRVRLVAILENRLKWLAPTPEKRLAMGRAITEGVETYLKELKSAALEEQVDVGELCSEVEKYLAQARSLVSELQKSLPDVKVTVSSGLSRKVIVRRHHRVVLREFPVGTALVCKQLLRSDGELGGVELLEMR